MTRERDHLCHQYIKANEALQQLDLESRAYQRELAKLRVNHEELSQDLEQSKIWAKRLEETNKDLTLKIKALTTEYDALLTELRASELAHNDVTIQVTQAKLTAQQQRAAIRIAIDNFNLATKDI